MATKTPVKKKIRAGEIPAPDASQNTDFNTFLKADDIGKLGAEASLVLTGETRIVDGAFGEQIVCEVKYGREVYDWPVKVNSPNHRLLFERFGAKMAKWRGPVKVTIKNFANKDYIAVQRGK